MASSKTVLEEALQRFFAREERTTVAWERANALCSAAVGKFAEALLGDGFCRERNAQMCGESLEGTVSWSVGDVGMTLRIEPGRVRVIAGDSAHPANVATFYLPDQIDALAEYIAHQEWKIRGCARGDNEEKPSKEAA